MPRVGSVRNAFTAGVLDETALGRVDLAVYQQGLKTGRNWIAKSLGSARARPGMNYMADVGADGQVFDYLFDDDEAYVVCLVTTGLKIYRWDGSTLTACSISSGSIPYTTALQCRNAKYAAAGDKIFLFHEDFPVQEITRTGATTFTVANYAFDTGTSTGNQVYQPYYRYADQGITMTLSALTGAGVTITMSSAVFVNSGAVTHIGTRFRRMFATNDWREIEITGVTSSTVATGTVRGNLSSASMGATTATVDWDEQMISTVRGYPRCGALISQRIWMAGFRDRPNGIVGSQVGDFYNFFLGTALDAEGIDFEIFDTQVHAIRAILGHRHLQVYTNSAEFFAKGESYTPGTFALTRSTPFGCNGVQPLAIDGATLFCQANNGAIREFVYDDTQQSYDSEVVSLFAPSLISTPIAQVVTRGTQADPEQYAFFPMTAGTMAVFLSIRAQKVAAWFQFTTDGLYLGAANLAYTGQSSLFFFVKRTINAVTKYYLELWDATHVLDCAITKTPNPTTRVVTGLSHLEGKVVSVVGNNWFLGTYTVSSGQITLDEHAAGITSVVVGLNPDDLIETTPLVVDFGLGPSLDQRVRINRITIGYISSLAISVQGRAITFRQVNDDHSLAAVAQTGEKRYYPLQGWVFRPTIEIRKGAPLPTQISFIHARLSV